ncbi:HNH endonuclease [Ralstonia phage RP13]|nr:HNH endonuclease [Ralstonia phage RP13]
MSQSFEEWKSNQDFSHGSIWFHKWRNKKYHAKQMGVEFDLTIDQYLFKAYEAGITSPEQISPNGFALSRVGDIGGYNKDNCRFLDYYDNLLERKAVGGGALGEKHRSAKLTKDKVRSIRKDNRSNSEIAIDYNVTPQTISDIKLRKTWYHVQD